MSMLPVHAKATRHPGTVCGADDGPLTRLSDDGHLVTCPDCDPSTAEIEALPDDVNPGDPDVIDRLREAAAGRWRKIHGVVVDATTANAIITVYDALNDANKAKLAALRIDHMAALAWRLLRPRDAGGSD